MSARECHCTWHTYRHDCPHTFHAAIALRSARLPAPRIPDVDDIRAAFDAIVSREFQQ